MAGRPKVHIITDEMRAAIIRQRLSGMPWNIIAESLNISDKVLRAYRYSDLEDPLRHVNDEILAPIIYNYLEG